MNVVFQRSLQQRLLDVISTKFYLTCPQLHIEVLWLYTVQKHRLQHSTLRCCADYVTAKLKYFLLEPFADRLFYIPLLQAHLINKVEDQLDATITRY